MALFLDTSALVKLFVEEPGSDELEEAAGRETIVFVAFLAPHEFVSALLRKVEAQEISSERADAVLVDFRTMLGAKISILSFREELSDRAFDLLRRHARAGLRTLDAFQLASCLEIPGATLGLADCVLERIARMEGVEARLFG